MRTNTRSKHGVAAERPTERVSNVVVMGDQSLVWINSTSRYASRSELSLGEASGHYIPGSLRRPPQLYPLVDGTSTPNPLRALRLDEHFKQSLLWSVVGT